MFDLTVFFSNFLALLAAFSTMEIFSIILGFFLSKKNARKQQELEQEFAKAISEGRMPEGVNPMQLMMSGMPVPYPLPTASGEEVAAPDSAPAPGQV